MIGIEDFSIYYPVFKQMESLGVVLNLHGEVPNVDVLHAEEDFLQHLTKIHSNFPKLKIVLEHVTTKKSIDLVKTLGDTVACTITIHHLDLIIDDWAGKVHNYCKPVAKLPHDRDAIQSVIKEGEFI